MVLRQWKRPLTFLPRPLGDMFCKSEGLIQSGTHILSYCDDSFAIELCPLPIGRPGTGTCRPSLSLYYALWMSLCTTTLNLIGLWQHDYIPSSITFLSNMRHN